MESSIDGRIAPAARQGHAGTTIPCAAWCRLCDDYAPVFVKACDELQQAGVALRRHWIDIEDEAELVGDFDVETFPTLVMIGPNGVVRFAGPLTPQPDTLRRLLRAIAIGVQPDARWPPVPPAITAFAARLRARVAGIRPST